MNKPELLAEITKESNLSLFVTNYVLNLALDTITERVLSGEKVYISGFGTFELKERKPHPAANPRTGEKIMIDGYESVVFKMSASLKEKVKNRKNYEEK